MSEILRRVQTLVLDGDFLVSEHGFDELEDDANSPVMSSQELRRQSK